MENVNCRYFPSIFPFFFDKHRCGFCFGAWRAGDTEAKRRPRHLSSARVTKPIISVFHAEKWSTHKMRRVGVVVEMTIC